MSICVIVVAAGRGARMRTGVPKAFLSLHGRPLFAYSLETLARLPAVESLVLVAPAERVAEAAELARAQGPRTVALEVAAGGAERQDSVSAGLERAGNADLVVIHDAARPFVSLESATACVRAAASSGAAILGLPASDTVKLAKEGSTVVAETLDRSRVWLAQTPQVFRTELLRRAYALARRAGHPATDDASLVERLGTPVTLVPGDEGNRKITTPADWAWAEWVAAQRP